MRAQDRGNHKKKPSHDEASPSQVAFINALMTRAEFIRRSGRRGAFAAEKNDDNKGGENSSKEPNERLQRVGVKGV